MLLSGLIIGLILGFIFQRGRFCVTGAFRDVWLSGATRWLKAFLLAIAVQAVIVQIFVSLDLIHPALEAFAPLAVAGGSLIFGIGIVAAGGCATGTYYRSGEGLVGSWVALGFYAFSSAVMKHGIGQPLEHSARSYELSENTIYGTFGISPWVLVIAFAIFVSYLFYRQHQQTAKIAALPAKRSGIAHLLFEKRWSPNATALAVGIIAAIAYPLSEATGRAAGLGVTTPSANIIAFLTTGNTQLIDWGMLFVLGIIPGSYLAAKLSGEFKIRVPDAKTVVRAIWGGSLMGIGAAIAGGCSIGNSLVYTALFSWQGWAALLFTFIGVGIGAKLLIQPQKTAQVKLVVQS
ncbi:YeeE/YedE family protein [Arcanobacterium hippocoleae]|uniref:YeeE/YedE family protein n=1 Tax=Arcanobacterium hippocoleae TaxID=149017 RepID=UPI0033409985